MYIVCRFTNNCFSFYAGQDFCGCHEWTTNVREAVHYNDLSNFPFDDFDFPVYVLSDCSLL